MPHQTSWRNYEEVAQFLLNEFASHFALGRVEGKQKISGANTTWQIDAKGVQEGSERLIIIECRRHTGQGLSQEDIGALAYRIKDTGAAGLIIVSPLPLQSGGKNIAKNEGIVEVLLDENSTTTDYILDFLNKLFIGRSDGTIIGDKLDGEVIRSHDQN
jgi:hypothetical protein